MTTYGVLGTGVVGQTFAAKLAALGHEVRMGTRDVAAARARTEPGQAGAEALGPWLDTHPEVLLATFADAVAGSEILIDLGNPLDFSSGQLDLTVKITDSLGETLQREFPNVRVVKALNMMTAAVMVDPASVGGGEHTAFIAGNHEAAKSVVTTLLHSFGWRDVRDLGDISGARGMEAYLVLWVRGMQAFGTPMFNIKLVV